MYFELALHYCKWQFTYCKDLGKDVLVTLGVGCFLGSVFSDKISTLFLSWRLSDTWTAKGELRFPRRISLFLLYAPFHFFFYCSILSRAVCVKSPSPPLVDRGLLLYVPGLRGLTGISCCQCPGSICCINGFAESLAVLVAFEIHQFQLHLGDLSLCLTCLFRAC